jgi:S1-C subfamily serine protease
MGSAAADPLPDIIDRIRPSIVGVGTYEATRRPPSALQGSGFAVGDGKLVATSLHVVQAPRNDARKERLVVFVGRGRAVQVRGARVLAQDPVHDLALLAIDGAPLPALDLGDSDSVREGMPIAFTGFPIGGVLGLYPVTHTGIVSALTPIIIPAPRAADLTGEDVKLLRNPYEVIQLDAVAYPGNSGSPVYDAGSGAVIGIVNKVFVKAHKEDILKEPSAITYAMPSQPLRRLLRKARTVDDNPDE